MGITLKRFQSPPLNLLIYSGTVNRQMVLDFYPNIDPNNPANANPWLTYMPDDVDISELDLMVFVELKRALEPILKALTPDKPLVSALMTGSRTNAAILNLWRGYVGRDPQYNSEPTVFSSLAAAFDHLGLPQDTRGVVEAAIAGEGVAPPPEAERRRAP
jgi:hypothetical protein